MPGGVNVAPQVKQSRFQDQKETEKKASSSKASRLKKDESEMSMESPPGREDFIVMFARF